MTDFTFKAKIVTVDKRYCFAIYLRCGGTLITVDHVLTVAHCISDVHAMRLRVILGGLRQDGLDGVSHTCKELIPHKRYSSERNSFNYDIGIIVVSNFYFVDFFDRYKFNYEKL